MLGILVVDNDLLMMKASGLAISSATSFSRLGGRSSIPGDLFCL